LAADAESSARVGALDIVEQLLAVARYNEQTPSEQSVNDAVRRVFSSLCFRLRRWRSAPQHPLSVHTSGQSSRATFERYARHIVATERDTPHQHDDLDNLDTQAGRECFARWRAAETGHRRLRAAHRSVLDATDALRCAAPPQPAAPASEVRRPSDALAYLLGSLEAATFVSHRSLLGAQAVLECRDLAGTAFARASKLALQHLVTPFTNAAGLRHYQRQFAHSVQLAHMPLCAPALAESSAIGGTAFNSLVSEWRRDASSKHDHMLYNGGVPRPLTGTLPLLSELTFLNWYEPGDGEPELSASASPPHTAAGGSSRSMSTTDSVDGQ
jgi:hypothetical protein